MCAVSIDLCTSESRLLQLDANIVTFCVYIVITYCVFGAMFTSEGLIDSGQFQIRVIWHGTDSMISSCGSCDSNVPVV